MASSLLYDGDEIDLLYILGQHGWSDVAFWVRGEITQIRITHVFSDPVSDLVQLALDLHERVPGTELIWWDEPGGHALVFDRLPEQQHKYIVRISSFPEGPPLPSKRTEELQLEFEAKADHLVKLIYTQLEKVSRLMEEKSYREAREFSYQEFKRLKTRLAT